jgi:hypothetical protein
MAQTREGALKVQALKAGISVEEYQKKILDGQKWCYLCRAWHPLSFFGVDKTRYDGFVPACMESRNRRGRERYVPIPSEKRKPHGPPAKEPRDGDKKQARRRINVLVRTDRLPHPNSVPCVDCGHVWKKGQRRHEYDHVKGYGKESHYKVEVVCTTCHGKRAVERGEYRGRKNKHRMV